MEHRPFRVRIFGETETETCTLSGFFDDTDSKFEERTAINLLGTIDEAISLVKFERGFARFEIFGRSGDERQYSGVGHLSSIQYGLSGSDRAVVHQIANIQIIKISQFYDDRSDNSLPRRAIYVLAPRIKDWPKNRDVVVSFDGTITPWRREMREMRARREIKYVGRVTFRLERHYFYDREDANGSLRQSWLPAITISNVRGRSSFEKESTDFRVFRIIVVILSFYFNANITPFAKFLSGKVSKDVYWPHREIKTVERSFRQRSIHSGEISEFLAISFENLWSSGLEINRLSVIVGRFVDGVNADSSESRITYITEAIEGLVTFCGLNKKSNIEARLLEYVSSINEIISAARKSGFHVRKISHEHILTETAWTRCKSLIERIYPENDVFRDACLKYGRFFSIRNAIVHQGAEASDNDVQFQIDIAAHVFRLLFCYIVGCSHIRPMPGHALEYSAQSGDLPDRETVSLWE